MNNEQSFRNYNEQHPIREEKEHGGGTILDDNSKMDYIIDLFFGEGAFGEADCAGL